MVCPDEPLRGFGAVSSCITLAGESPAAVSAEEELARVREILARLRLQRHPGKTRLVELGLGRFGFEFLGCHPRIVRSHFKGKCYLFRWPSSKAMNAVRQKIRDLTDRRRWAGMADIRDVIRVVNPVLRGWGSYFRTGNASAYFHRVDSYVRQRLLQLLERRGNQRRKRVGGRPFCGREWPPRRLVTDHCLYQCWARFVIRELRMPRVKTIGQPDAGNPHVRFERGPQETEPARHRA